MKIETIEQFDRLFKALALELTYANVHYQLFLDVNASFTEYQKEVNQSPAFWGIARDSIKDVATLGLCRVYDPDHRTNSLPNLLLEIRDNPEFISIVMAAEVKKPIDKKQLSADIEFSSAANASVLRLIRWRSDLFVHINARRIANEKPLSSEHIPKYEDFEFLLKDGMKIINRYAGALRNTEYATDLIRGDDYKFVLESIRVNLVTKRKAYAEELRGYGLDPKNFGVDE